VRKRELHSGLSRAVLVAEAWVREVFYWRKKRTRPPTGTQLSTTPETRTTREEGAADLLPRKKDAQNPTSAADEGNTGDLHILKKKERLGRLREGEVGISLIKRGTTRLKNRSRRIRANLPTFRKRESWRGGKTTVDLVVRQLEYIWPNGSSIRKTTLKKTPFKSRQS